MRRLALLLAPALLPALLVAGAARADEFGTDAGSARGGYRVDVQVQLSGNAAPGGGSTRTLSVPAACWWAPANGPYTDAAAMLDWFDTVEVDDSRGQVALYGPREIWQDAADREAAGEDLSWYRAHCRDPDDYPGFTAGATEDVDLAPDEVRTWEVYFYRAFPAGAAVPPPLVDPADLAAAARDVMVIPVPVTDRNPRIASPGAPTLVGLPTWFWVQDPAAVGGATGTRTIRAQVGDVWAEVVARTTGLRLRSPAGGATCPPARATTVYGPGVPVTSACTVEFSRASVAYRRGYPVTASTGWEATWTGSGGTAGVLDPLARTVTQNVPVAEVQNVVTR